MKFLSLVALATTISAAAEIKGNAGVSYCDGKESRLTINEINVEPYPPVPGQPIKVTATGHSTHELSSATEVELHFHKGIIKRTVSQNVCKGKQVCPSTELDMTFEKMVPSHAPKGKYDVMVKVVDGEQELTCLRGKLKIGK